MMVPLFADDAEHPRRRGVPGRPGGHARAGDPLGPVVDGNVLVAERDHHVKGARGLLLGLPAALGGVGLGRLLLAGGLAAAPRAAPPRALLRVVAENIAEPLLGRGRLGGAQHPYPNRRGGDQDRDVYRQPNCPELHGVHDPSSSRIPFIPALNSIPQWLKSCADQCDGQPYRRKGVAGVFLNGGVWRPANT